MKKIIILFILLLSSTAYAGYPLVTDDGGTKGKGNFEVELGVKHNEMRDPKEIFTESGYEDYLYYLKAIEKGLVYITNMADDLLIDPDDLDALWEVEELLPKLKDNNGEEYED